MVRAKMGTADSQGYAQSTSDHMYSQAESVRSCCWTSRQARPRCNQTHTGARGRTFHGRHRTQPVHVSSGVTVADLVAAASSDVPASRFRNDVDTSCRALLLPLLWLRLSCLRLLSLAETRFAPAGPAVQPCSSDTHTHTHTHTAAEHDRTPRHQRLATSPCARIPRNGMQFYACAHHQHAHTASTTSSRARVHTRGRRRVMRSSSAGNSACHSGAPASTSRARLQVALDNFTKKSQTLGGSNMPFGKRTGVEGL